MTFRKMERMGHKNDASSTPTQHERRRDLSNQRDSLSSLLRCCMGANVGRMDCCEFMQGSSTDSARAPLRIPVKTFLKRPFELSKKFCQDFLKRFRERITVLNLSMAHFLNFSKLSAREYGKSRFYPFLFLPSSSSAFGMTGLYVWVDGCLNRI